MFCDWGGYLYLGVMIDVASIRTRFERLKPFLDERERRLSAANDAMSLGHGGVTAVSVATGVARNTINRENAELKVGRNELVGGVRRPGAGRKREVERQLGLLAALEAVIEDAIRGILVALNLQTSFLTPPMAMAAYYLKGVAPPHVQLIEIFKGCLPFLSMVFLAMFILYTFPGIALWLPKLVYGG